MSKARNAGKVAFFVCFQGCLRTWLMLIAFLARYAGKILQFWRSLVEKLFAQVSWKTLVLEGFIPSFGESLVENARFGRLHSQFFGKSRGKRSF